MHCWWDCKLLLQLQNTMWVFLKKQENLPNDSAQTLLHICPKDSNFDYRDSCSSLVTVALFAIARRWKQPPYPSTQECTTKVGILTRWNVTQLLKKMKCAGKFRARNNSEWNNPDQKDKYVPSLVRIPALTLQMYMFKLEHPQVSGKQGAVGWSKGAEIGQEEIRRVGGWEYRVKKGI